jgi:hypothetical protein
LTVTVACVLRTGNRVVDKVPYGVEHVTKLRNGVRANLRQPHRFVCLTDMVDEVEAAGVDALRLPTDWHGWWSKINLFAPDLLTGSVLYLDLDSLVTGPLDPLFRQSEGITMVADFTRPEMMNSSAMAWIGDYSAIWHKFGHGFESISRQYDRIAGPRIGDQGFIHDTLRGGVIDTFESTHVVSFKRSSRSCTPVDARVISFHGSPKLDSPDAGWAYDAWSAL